MSERLSIRELKSDAPANPGTYLVHAQVARAQQKKARTGTMYLEWQISDGESNHVVRAFGDSPVYKEASEVQTGTFVEIEGHWHESNYGVDVRDWKFRLLDESESAEMLAGPADLRKKQEADYGEIEKFVMDMSDPRLRSVCELFLARFGDRFRRSGAARNNHHARRGGLVEHVAQMMRAANAVAGVYPPLNRDLLFAGVLFHDCGKLWENCYAEQGFTMPYNESGEMLGHITLGIELVNKLWNDLVASEEAADWPTMEPRSEEVRLHLLHLIASHHGQLDFGAPVVPKTPEAQALHYIDNLDAKLEMFFAGYQSSAQLAPNVFEKVWPLPGNLVRPLPKFTEPAPLLDQMEEG